jgi:hypothetical protein
MTDSFPLVTLDPELEAILHPAKAYARPQDVLNDPDLTRYEKRVILSSWASDACAVEAMPALRKPPHAPKPVQFDEIIDALCKLDDDDPPPRPGGVPARVRRDAADPDQGGWGQQL